MAERGYLDDKGMGKNTSKDEGIGEFKALARASPCARQPLRAPALREARRRHGALGGLLADLADRRALDEKLKSHGFGTVGQRKAIELALRWPGTLFSMQVWSQTSLPWAEHANNQTSGFEPKRVSLLGFDGLVGPRGDAALKLLESVLDVRLDGRVHE